MTTTSHSVRRAAAWITAGAALVACNVESWSAQTDNGELEIRAQFATAGLGSGFAASERPVEVPAADSSADGATMQAAAASDFDWCISAGGATFFNTASTTLIGGPDCVPTTAMNVVGGLVRVRNFTVEQGALLRVVGPNPFVVVATGEVRIDGTIDLSGSNNPGVITLNTTNLPEVGAPGQVGGGAGGTGSPVTNDSSFAGGHGQGAYGLPDQGGQGGETGWNNIANAQVNGRRGAGGGGGRLGGNQGQVAGSVALLGQWDQSHIGLDAEPGFPNLDPNANGASSNLAGPLGGAAGPGPFSDTDPRNDFYGVAVDLDTGEEIVGELKTPWAGAGGGAGGDASFVGIGGTFPSTPFNPNGDEKGSGGAGGGGSFHLISVGDIRFGPLGLIKARGGNGGGGENTLFLNRVGGGSGGGSGGHVILETAGVIDLSASAGPSTTAGQLSGGILATGGQGGAGRGDAGGATSGPNGSQETVPNLDACPPTDSSSGEYPTTGPNACQGHIDGAGGDGGPGLIQLHTRNGFGGSDPSILLPPGLSARDLFLPLPVGTRQNLRLKTRFELSGMLPQD